MNKIRIKRGIILLIWMLLIFIMSHTPGNISGKESQFVVKILSIIGIDKQGEHAYLISFLVRKLAHFSEYFILSILAYRFFVLKSSFKKAIILSILSTIVYSCSDEIHQLFIQEIGRASCRERV